MGPEGAPVTIVVFSDFQCPFCAKFAHTLERLRKRDSTSIRIVFRNVPIQGLHPFARDAAVAAECSAAEGRFAQFHDLLFSQPDSIGKWSWKTVGLRIGLDRAEAIEDCMKSELTLTRFTADSLDAIALRIPGTPTIMVNQWLLRSGAPPDSVFNSIVDKELAHLGKVRRS